MGSTTVGVLYPVSCVGGCVCMWIGSPSHPCGWSAALCKIWDAGAGETGLVLKVDGNILSIFSDLSQREMSVFEHHAQQCAEVSIGREMLGTYTLYDMVQLDALTVGVIVKVRAFLKGACAPGDARVSAGGTQQLPSDRQPR